MWLDNRILGPQFLFLSPLKILLHCSLTPIVLLHLLMLMRIILLILAHLFYNLPLFFPSCVWDFSLQQHLWNFTILWLGILVHICAYVYFPFVCRQVLDRSVCLSTYMYFNSGEFVSSYLKYFFSTVFLFSHGTFIRWWNFQLYFSYLLIFFILSISSFFCAMETLL